MNMTDLIRKLTSRKFLLALVGVASGLALAFGVEGGDLQEIITTVGGLIAAAGSVIAYINGEAKVDAARVEAAPAAPEEKRVPEDCVVKGFGGEEER